jgi:BASS family bile acid:Na+ symporter
MTTAQWLTLALQVSLFLLMVTLGLKATLRDLTFLFRHPAMLIRAVLSMFVVMVVLAVIADRVFNLPPAVKIALVFLALAPVPPILPAKQFKAGGSQSYVFGLLVGAAVVSLAVVPIALKAVERVFDVPLHMPMPKVISAVMMSIIAPLVVGVVLSAVAPGLARRIARPMSIAATVVLVLAFLPVLFSTLPLLWELVGNGVLIALFAFSVVGLIVGHLLGGPDPDNRSVLALATAARHPAVALSIAMANFPDERAVVAVVLYHLIVAAIVSLPYLRRRKSHHLGAPQRPAYSHGAPY